MPAVSVAPPRRRLKDAPWRARRIAVALRAILDPPP
jgi:hypothetical protein